MASTLSPIPAGVAFVDQTGALTTFGRLRWQELLNNTQQANTNQTALPFFNVLTYGASPGVTDNTAAIQATLDAVVAAGGGVVWIPGGRFDFVGPLTVSAPMLISGAGRGVTQLRCTSASAHGLVIATPYVTCSDFDILSTFVNGAGRTGDGLHINAAAGAENYFERLNFIGHANGSYNAGQGNSWRQCIASGNRLDGFLFDGSSVAQNETDVDFCQSNGNGANGFRILGSGLGLHFNYCVAAVNPGAGIFLNGTGVFGFCGDCYIVAPEMSANGTNIYCIDAINVFIGQMFLEAASAGDGLTLTGCQYVTVSGGIAQGATTLVAGNGITSNSADVSISGVLLYSNAGSGIALTSGSTRHNLTGNSYLLNKYGLRFDAGSLACAIAGGTVYGNTTAPTLNAYPASTRISACIGLVDQ